MTFKELQDFVLSDRFDETKRADAKIWLNHRYGRLWAMEPWTFKKSTATLSLSSGASSVALTGFQRIEGIWDASTSPNFDRMGAIRPEDFYSEKALTSSIPEGFTIIGNTVYFDRTASGARSYQVLGELAFVPLSADGDVPLLPTEFHPTLAHGAISEGLRMEADPAWQGAEQDFVAGIADMRAGYLTQVRTYDDVFPAWP